MLTEDRIDELILEAQNWEEHAQLGDFAKEVIAITERLRAEVERQSAVIAALREALGKIANEAADITKTMSHTDKDYQAHVIVTMANDALADAAPVEPAPAERAYVVDDRVIVREGHKLAGMVGSVWDVYKGGLKGYYTVELDDIGLHTFTHAQLDREPTEPEAPAREIAAGDRVVTIYGHHGQVTRIDDDGRPNPYTVRFAAATTDSSEFFAGQYTRDEIEPA